MWCNKTVKLCLIQCLHIIFRVFFGQIVLNNHHCCQHSPNPVLNLLILCIWCLDFSFGLALLVLKRCHIQPTGLRIWAHITVLTHGKQRLMCCCACQSQSVFAKSDSTFSNFLYYVAICQCNLNLVFNEIFSGR